MEMMFVFDKLYGIRIKVFFLEKLIKLWCLYLIIIFNKNGGRIGNIRKLLSCIFIKF